MRGAVTVQELVKDFRTFDRKEGLQGALANLFRREYKTFRAVDHISFDIAPGEMVGYIGPNGAGKSTTIKMLTGILLPTSGSVAANGYRPWQERTRYTHSIGVVFGQRTQLWWDIAVVESMRLLQRIYGVSEADYQARMKRFDSLLDLGRYLHTPVRKLSLGERMRCDVAAALLHNPPLLFLDEPTIGLDIVAKENIRGFLQEINRDYGTTMLLTTHDLGDIEELCQRLMIIDQGKLLFEGKLAELKRRLWREAAVRFDVKDHEHGNRLGALQIAGVTPQQAGELSWRFRYDPEERTAADVIRAVVTAVEVLDIAIEEQNIDEVVKRIYQGDAFRETAG